MDSLSKDYQTKAKHFSNIIWIDLTQSSKFHLAEYDLVIRNSAYLMIKPSGFKKQMLAYFSFT